MVRSRCHLPGACDQGVFDGYCYFDEYCSFPVGVCFGHQLIAHCLGAKVDRAPHGWCLGRHTYTWHEPQYFEEHTEQVSLLASHPRDHRHEPQSQILGHLAHYGAPPQTGWRHVYSAGQLMASFRSQFKCAFIVKAKGFKTLPTWNKHLPRNGLPQSGRSLPDRYTMEGS